MADNTIQTGSDTIATDDLGGGVKVQRAKVGFGADGVLTDVAAATPLPTALPADTVTTGNLTAAQPVINTPVSNATVQLAVPDGHCGWSVDLSGTYSAGTILAFDASLDGGTTWRQAITLPRGGIGALPNYTTNGGAYAFGVTNFDGLAAGYTHVRVRCTTYTASDSVTVRIRVHQASGAVVPIATFPIAGTIAAGSSLPSTTPPIPLGSYNAASGNVELVRAVAKGIGGSYALLTQDVKNSNRVNIMWTIDRVAQAASAETLATVTESRDAGSTSTFTSKTITNGARLHLTSIAITVETGGTTPTLGRVYVRIRANTGGATTTSSAIQAVYGCNMAAAASTITTAFDDFPDGFEILGNGTRTIGVTIAAMDYVVTTKIPTVSVTIFGFEY